MIYGLVRGRLLRLLKVAPGPPEPPAGTHGSVQVFRADPAFLRYRLVGWGLGGAMILLVFAAVAVGAGLAGETAGVVVAAVAALVTLVVLGVVYAGVRIDYDVRHYVFTDRSMRVREGAWQVREMTLSFANVQNLRVTQGPLQRFFGISDLRVDTAGGGGAATTGGGRAGGGHTLTVAGIRNATELRDMVGRYARRRADAGLGDPDDPPQPPARIGGAGPPSEAVRDGLVGVLEAARELRRAVEEERRGRR